MFPLCASNNTLIECIDGKVVGSRCKETEFCSWLYDDTSRCSPNCLSSYDRDECYASAAAGEMLLAIAGCDRDNERFECVSSSRRYQCTGGGTSYETHEETGTFTREEGLRRCKKGCNTESGSCNNIAPTQGALCYYTSYEDVCCGNIAVTCDGVYMQAEDCDDIPNTRCAGGDIPGAGYVDFGCHPACSTVGEATHYCYGSKSITSECIAYGDALVKLDTGFIQCSTGGCDEATGRCKD